MTKRKGPYDRLPSISARVIARKLAERGEKTLFLLFFQLSRINSSGNVWFEGERREMSSPSRRAWRANFTSRETSGYAYEAGFGRLHRSEKMPPLPKKEHTVPLRTIRHKTDHDQ